MDEELPPLVKTDNIDPKIKADVSNQLDSIINPTSKPKTDGTNVTSYYSGGEIKTEPLIKIKDIPGVENTQTGVPQETQPQIQKRPIVRTYKSDVEETIQTGHISSINMALAENRRAMGQAQKTDMGEKRAGINKNILIISLVLIIGGALTFFVPKLLIQLQYGEKKVPVETVDSKPIMTVDVEEKINIKNLNLSRVSTTLKERILQSSTKLGQLKNIFLVEGDAPNEKLITATNFLTLINANPPSDIQRTIKDPYMFGSYNYNGNQTFLVLKVGSFDTTFSGMLRWETNLWQDFKELFNLQSEETSSTENTFALEIKKFQDATFDNKDCRVVKNSDGNIVFLYSIIDENTIVITTGPDTLKEIINRVSKARVVTQ